MRFVSAIIKITFLLISFFFQMVAVLAVDSDEYDPMPIKVSHLLYPIENYYLKLLSGCQTQESKSGAAAEN